MRTDIFFCPARLFFGVARVACLAAFLVLGLAACQRKDPMVNGKLALDKGDYSAAVIEFKNALQAAPDSVEPRLALATALERSNDLAAAETQLQKALAHGGDEDALVPRLALLMLDRGDLEKLTRDFKDKHLKDAAAESTLRGALAIAYNSLKRPQLAAEQLKDAGAAATVQLARAQMLAAEGKWAAALAELGQSATQAGAPWWVLRAASRILAASGDNDRALAVMKLAHDAAPWHSGVRGEYGETLIAAGQIEAATQVRDQMRKQSGNQFWFHYLDAILQARAGRKEESHAAALKVLAVRPEHIPAGLLAASAELQKGELQMAERRLLGLAKQQPDALPVLRLLAQAQLRSARPAEAAETLRHGLALAPEDGQLTGLRAELELARGQHQKALLSFGAVLAAHPDDAGLMLRLAELRAGLGEHDAAQALLERAAQASLKEPALYARIVATALRQGHPALARRLADAGATAQPSEPLMQLTLAATQSAQQDAAGAWATTLAVLDKNPSHDGALSALKAMARTPEQEQLVLARYAKAVSSGALGESVYLTYAAMLRADPAAKPLEVLESGLRKLPEAVGLRAELVQAYMRLGQADKAISTAESGAAQNNASAAAQELLARIYERNGKLSAATEAYRKLVANYPQRSDWRLKLAQLEIAAQRQPAAISLLRGLITERPFDPLAYATLAQLVAHGNPAEALSIAHQMGQRTELKGAALLLEGDVLLATGKGGEALAVYARAAKAGMSPKALLRTVAAFDAMDRRAAGDQALRAALHQFPSEASVLGFAAARAQAAGEAAKAVDWLQQLSKQMPGNPLLLNDLAWAQVQANNPAALANARKAAQALPDNANALDTLGMALAKAGQQAEAISTLRLAANMAPQLGQAQLHLSELLFAAGDRNAATERLRAVDAAQLSEQDRKSLNKLKLVLGET